MRDIGKNIRKLRVERGMTQDALAEALFVTRQTVSNYETGRSRPDVDMLLQIAQVLQTDANTVLYGPTVPGIRKQNYRRLIIGAGILLALLIPYLILYPICMELRTEQLRTMPLVLLLMSLRPAWMLVLGWVAVHGVATLMNGKPLEYSWVKYVRWGLLGLLAVCLALLMPYVLWFAEGVILDLFYSGEISRSYHHFWLDYYLSKIFMEQPWVLTVCGGALWIFGFPKARKKITEETE